MRFLLAGLLLTQAAPAQSEAEKMEAALKKFGTRTYSALLEGKNAGTRTLKATVVTEKDRKVAVLEATEVERGKQTDAALEKAELKGLKLISMKVTTAKPAKADENTLKVEGLKASMRLPDTEPALEFDVTENTVGDLGFLLRVCAAEQKEGAALTLDLLSWGIPQVQNLTLKCEGKKQVDVGGKKVDAYLWAGKNCLDFELKYWISPDGYLLRWVEAETIEYVLESK